MRSLLLAFFTASLAVASLAQDLPPPPLSPAAPLLLKGDALDAKLQNRDALACYSEAEKLEPKNVAILWRMARQSCLMMNDTTDVHEKQRLGEAGLAYALKAVEIDPKDEFAQLSVAICYGRLAVFMDNKTKLGYSRKVKEFAERAMALNPKDDMTYHVLGLWNYELSSLGAVSRTVARMVYGEIPATSFQQAAELFEKAVKLNPKRLSHHVELGRAYAALGKKDEARKELNLGLSMPNKEKDDANVKKKATDALEKL